MSPTAPLPDAAPDNWVDRWAPPRLAPWLKLGRLDRPAGAWLLLLPGWQGIALASALHPDPLHVWATSLRLMALFFAGAVVMRAAGCAFNDIVDRDIDMKVARTAARPLASGRISRRGAVVFVVGCSLVGLAILLTLNALTIALGVASLALVAIYPFMKRITWWPQAWLGLTFNWGALMGFAAVQGSLAWPTLLNPALLLYVGGVFWTLGYDTIYAVQDLEDDALVGVRSSARRLGAGLQRGVALFYVLAILFASTAAQAADLGPATFGLLTLYAAHLAWQAWRVRVHDPRGALRLFRSNRVAGLLLFAALALGAWRG